MIDRNDPSVLWVSASSVGGDGTFDSPLESLEAALGIVQPGATIVLRDGIYEGNSTIEISGTKEKPVWILAESQGGVEVRGGCWFFYDTSDLIVSGFTFVDAPFGAVSVIGACERNRFDNLTFRNCGQAKDASSTFFFGGSGARCNIVEDCRFERVAVPQEDVRQASLRSIALMVSEGDGDEGASHGIPNKDHLFRKNTFVNYDYGILLGTRDDSSGFYGHVVEYNIIESCREEGILVKCGDTQVRGNMVKCCRRNSIAVKAGGESVIEQNWIVDCASGIIVHGDSHTVTNNCIVRCGAPAILAGGEEADVPAASNLFVENNTCIDCGESLAGEDGVTGVHIAPGVTCIVRRNLFSGRGRACSPVVPSAPILITDNMAAGSFLRGDGVVEGRVEFRAFHEDDFTNDSGYGASGWNLRPDPIDPDCDILDEEDYYRSPDSYEDESDGEVAREVETLIRDVFVGDEDPPASN